jgi:hypothetical protein
MQQATPTSPQPKQPLALLLIGPPGSGKSSLALQFPAPYIADIDLNLDGPIRHLRKVKPDFSYWYDTIPLDEAGKPVPVYDQWNRLQIQLAKAVKEPAVKTIVIDGLTHLNNILMAHVTKQAGKSDMDISLWIPFRKNLMEFIMWLRGSGKDLVMICHEELVYKADAKNIMQQTLVKRSPAVSSRLTDYFGGFFTDMWRCDSSPGPNNTMKYFVQITRTAVDDLKNSYGERGEIDVTKDGYLAIKNLLKLP